jgi:hypothetical protein
MEPSRKFSSVVAQRMRRSLAPSKIAQKSGPVEAVENVQLTLPTRVLRGGREVAPAPPSGPKKEYIDITGKKKRKPGRKREREEEEEEDDGDSADMKDFIVGDDEAEEEENNDRKENSADARNSSSDLDGDVRMAEDPDGCDEGALFLLLFFFLICCMS